MTNQKTILVVGLGEVGKPLLELISTSHRAVGVDISPPAENIAEVEVMHICYPFQIPDFVGQSVRYIQLYRPKLTIINSTVAVGTTRAVAHASGTNVVHSPVRGKHARMLQEIRMYTKFIGAITWTAGLQAEAHFASLGLRTMLLSSPEATELAKLTETTYFGLLIAWAQEIERYCDVLGTNYEEVTAFFKEIAYLPRTTFFPGIIGGHCVMPNIEILRRFQPTPLLEAIRTSNRLKARREEGGEAAIQPGTLAALGEA